MNTEGMTQGLLEELALIAQDRAVQAARGHKGHRENRTIIGSRTPHVPSGARLHQLILQTQWVKQQSVSIIKGSTLTSGSQVLTLRKATDVLG